VIQCDLRRAADACGCGRCDEKIHRVIAVYHPGKIACSGFAPGEISAVQIARRDTQLLYSRDGSETVAFLADVGAQRSGYSSHNGPSLRPIGRIDPALHHWNADRRQNTDDNDDDEYFNECIAFSTSHF